MNNKKIIKKAKRKFPKHEWIYVRVKEYATVPYEASFFHKIVTDSKKLGHTDYKLYIHDDRMSIRSRQFPLFEPIYVDLDDKLWIELFYVFKVVE